MRKRRARWTALMMSAAIAAALLFGIESPGLSVQATETDGTTDTTTDGAVDGTTDGTTTGDTSDGTTDTTTDGTGDDTTGTSGNTSTDSDADLTDEEESHSWSSDITWYLVPTIEGADEDGMPIISSVTGTATFTCLNCEETQEVEAVVEYVETTFETDEDGSTVFTIYYEATATDPDGNGSYSTTYWLRGTLPTEEDETDDEEESHSWSSNVTWYLVPTIEGADEDGMPIISSVTGTATFTCLNCGETQEVEAVVEYVETTLETDEDGSTVFTIYYEAMATDPDGNGSYSTTYWLRGTLPTEEDETDDSTDDSSSSSDSSSSDTSDSSTSSDSSDSSSSSDTSDSTETDTVTSATLTDTTDSDTNAYGAVMANTTEELAALVLTEEEAALLEAGESIDVWLEVTDISAAVSEEEQALVEACIGDGTAALYLDISMYKQVGSSDTVRITNTNGTTTISFALSADLVNTDETVTRVFQILRIHDGTATFLPTVYDSATGLITFETDAFSTYVLVVTDYENTTGVTNVGTTEGSDVTIGSADTGDTADVSDVTGRGAVATGDDGSLMFWLIVMMLAGAAFAGVILLGRRDHLR